MRQACDARRRRQTRCSSSRDEVGGDATKPALQSGFKMDTEIPYMYSLCSRGMPATMQEFEGEITYSSLEETSNYIKPLKVEFTLSKRRRRWDMVLSHPSVAVLLWHSELDAVVVVRQFRPPVYVSKMLEGGENKPDEQCLRSGFTYEICAGICDKGVSLEQTAKEEVMEECGYDVPIENFEMISNHVTAIGISGNSQYYFYARVDESMRIKDAKGGRVHGDEMIDVLALPLSEGSRFIADHRYAKGANLSFGVMRLLAFPPEDMLAARSDVLNSSSDNSRS